jgi:hypothetical protein
LVINDFETGIFMMILKRNLLAFTLVASMALTGCINKTLPPTAAPFVGTAVAPANGIILRQIRTSLAPFGNVTKSGGNFANGINAVGSNLWPTQGAVSASYSAAGQSLFLYALADINPTNVGIKGSTYSAANISALTNFGVSILSNVIPAPMTPSQLSSAQGIFGNLIQTLKSSNSTMQQAVMTVGYAAFSTGLLLPK